MSQRHISPLSITSEPMARCVSCTDEGVLYVYIFQRKYVCSQTTEPSRVNGKKSERNVNVRFICSAIPLYSNERRKNTGRVKVSLPVFSLYSIDELPPTTPRYN